MTELTMQRYFDETVNYLRQQPKRATRDDGTCLYLTDEGNKCAVGYWIPDGHPAQREIRGISGLSGAFPDLHGVAWPDTEQGLSLAQSLQSLHDHHPQDGGGLSADDEAKAQAIADKYNLQYTEAKS